MAGKLDQGGGPVWRYQDANNYYVARMNPLEDNYRVYKVVAGKRTQLGSVDVKVPARRVAHAASRPQGRPHPVLSRRQAVPRREGRHIQGRGQDRPVDQGRRPDLFCRFAGQVLKLAYNAFSGILASETDTVPLGSGKCQEALASALGRSNMDVHLERNQRIGSICWIMLCTDRILPEPPGWGFA